MKNLRRLRLKPFWLLADAGALPFQSPPIVILARSTDHARTLAVIRLGLYASASRKFEVFAHTPAQTPNDQKVLILGSSLTLETQRGSGEAIARFTEEFRRQHFDAPIVRTLQVKEGTELMTALRWGENGNRLEILDRRH